MENFGTGLKKIGQEMKEEFVDIHTYIHTDRQTVATYIRDSSKDTACTLVELHKAPKDLTEMVAMSNCVNTVFCSLNANSDLHRKIGVQLFCKIPPSFHLHHIPLLEISSGSG